MLVCKHPAVDLQTYTLAITQMSLPDMQLLLAQGESSNAHASMPEAKSFWGLNHKCAYHMTILPIKAPRIGACSCPSADPCTAADGSRSIMFATQRFTLHAAIKFRQWHVSAPRNRLLHKALTMLKTKKWFSLLWAVLFTSLPPDFLVYEYLTDAAR